MSEDAVEKYRERMARLAGDRNESPIEALLIGSLSTGSGFILCPTKPEYEWFSGRKVAIVPQFNLKPYRVDMALFFRKRGAHDDRIHGVCIECDGQKWHSSPEQIAADAERDRFISIHYRMPVWRYAGHAIHHDLANVADEIEQAIRDVQIGGKPDLKLARMVSGVLASVSLPAYDDDQDEHEDFD